MVCGKNGNSKRMFGRNRTHLRKGALVPWQPVIKTSLKIAQFLILHLAKYNFTENELFCMDNIEKYDS